MNTTAPTRFNHKTWLMPVLMALTVLLYVGVRLLDIDRLVTTDEPFWLGRSANFFRALVSGEFEHTYQMAHPGVMTMWAGTLAYMIHFPDYADLAAGNLNDVYSIEQVLRAMGQDPMEMMVTANAVKVVVQTVFFAIGLYFLQKLVSPLTTLITGILIAFSPMMSGFDSALHVDGLFTTICFTAIVVTCWAAFKGAYRNNRWQVIWPWIAAGILAGMAILTRATGMVLVGVVGLALLLQIITQIQAGKSPRSLVQSAILQCLAWAVSTLATIYVLLPALWVTPGSVIEKLWSWSSSAATEGHENPTFFRGIHIGDPGWAVYPVVLLWRMSPVEHLGLILLVVLGVRAWRQRSAANGVNTNFLLVCAVFVFVYVAAMSVGAKKFDRYILPVFPVLAVLSAQGLVLGKQWLAKRKTTGWKQAGYAVLIVALIVQAASWNSTRPYRLDYYNPVLGGAERAESVLQMGWGQGGDQVADFLLDAATEGPIIVQTSAVPSAFTYFLETDSPVQFHDFSLRTPAGWYETEYYVAGIQQTQRDIAPDYDLLQHYDPVHSIYIGGVSYFDIYNVRNLPLPPELMTPTACNFTFGDSITLMQIIGRDATVDMYFLTTSEPDPAPIEFEVTLVWPDETSHTESATLVPADNGYMSRLTISKGGIDQPLVEATIHIRATGDSGVLMGFAPWLEEPSERVQVHSECYYQNQTEAHKP